MESNDPRELQGTKPARFALGQCVATPAAITAIIFNDLTPGHLLARHVTGDWGDLDEEDKHANEAAIQNEERILSAYTLADETKLYVITEWDRSVTTILLCSEY